MAAGSPDGQQNTAPVAGNGRSASRAQLRQQLLEALRGWYGPRALVQSQALLPLGSSLVAADVVVYGADSQPRPVGAAGATGIPLLAVLVLDAAAPFGPQVAVARQLVAAGVCSCWLVEPTLHTVTITAEPGKYQSFNQHETLRDPATGIELELARLFA